MPSDDSAAAARDVTWDVVAWLQPRPGRIAARSGRGQAHVPHYEATASSTASGMSKFA